jgi:hypothetical protein
MLGRNCRTMEALREPISIPAETEQFLHAYLVHHPQDQKSIERVIEFRRRVGEEFERLKSRRPRIRTRGGFLDSLCSIGYGCMNPLSCLLGSTVDSAKGIRVSTSQFLVRTPCRA